MKAQELKGTQLERELKAWKAMAEQQYKIVRLYKYGDQDYPVEGALDACINNTLLREAAL